MEKRRVRLEVLAQIVTKNYDLNLQFGDSEFQKSSNSKKQDIQIEKPEISLKNLSGKTDENHFLKYQKGMTLIQASHLKFKQKNWLKQILSDNKDKPGIFRLWHTLDDTRCENLLTSSLPGTTKNLIEFIKPSVELAKTSIKIGELPFIQQIQLGIFLIGSTYIKETSEKNLDTNTMLLIEPKITKTIKTLETKIKEACKTTNGEIAYKCSHEIYDLLSQKFTEEDRENFTEDNILDSEIEEMGIEKDEYNDSEENQTQEVIINDEDEQEESISFTEEEVATLGHWSTPWFQLENKKKEIHPTSILRDEQTIMTPPEGKSSEYSEILENISSEIKVLTTKLLQIIQERTYTRYVGSYRSGKLNGQKLWKQRLEKFNLFQRREEPEKLDICFSLLVDESGSMNRESKYLAAREATVVFAEVLDRIRVPFEVIGYSTENSEAAMAASLGHIPAFKYRHIRHSKLQHRIYKSFEDTFSQTRNRLVNIYPRFNNWDEEHLLFAFKRITQRSEKEKIIIITSDGQPNGDASHLISTASQISRNGVRLIGVGVVDSFVEQIYENHIVVKELSQLTQEIVQILRKELLENKSR
ncbi:MAG: cobaltochelatase CobT-related protein [bacterium]